jgi:hypothetical protein
MSTRPTGKVAPKVGASPATTSRSLATSATASSSAKAKVSAAPAKAPVATTATGGGSAVRPTTTSARPTTSGGPAPPGTIYCLIISHITHIISLLLAYSHCRYGIWGSISHIIQYQLHHPIRFLSSPFVSPSSSSSSIILSHILPLYECLMNVMFVTAGPASPDKSAKMTSLLDSHMKGRVALADEQKER